MTFVFVNARDSSDYLWLAYSTLKTMSADDEFDIFIEINHEIFSMVILSLQLIQKGQLSVFGKRTCTSTG